MKKLLNLVMFVLVVFAMNGCQLAVTDDSKIDPETIYYPYSVVIAVYDGSFQQLDLEGMFDWNWLCNQNEINPNCTSMNYGDGLFIDSQSVFTHQDQTGDITTTNTTFEIKTTVYVNEENSNFIIYPSILYGTADMSDTYSNQIEGMMLQGNVSVNFVVTNAVGEYDTMTIDFTIAVATIDELSSVEFAEYDDDDQYIKSTIFSSIEEITDFSTAASTAYIIAIETYLDSEGNSYKVRTLLAHEQYYDFAYYSPKFTWNDGLVHNIVVFIEWASE